MPPPSSLVLRRFFCCAASAGVSPPGNKKNVVFLGSPKVATSVLDALFNASTAPDSLFKIAAIVTQPPSGRDRGRKLMPSPVAQHAIERGFSSDLIFTPEKAGEETFLADLRALNPELCITAAYGNILPSKFLEIPPIGARLLIRELPSLLVGSARLKAQPQDDTKATLAPKLTSEESWLSFDEEATSIHNKVRAFAGWPGTRTRVQVIDDYGNPNIMEIKIITSRPGQNLDIKSDGKEIIFGNGALLFPCAGKSWLEVLELQLPGKKVTRAREFWNGLRGQKLQKSL